MSVLKLEDCDLYYESHGTGRPFLFNAATATWGELWKFFQVEHFARDHQVIIFDQRGTGRSPVRSTDFSNSRLTADAAALLRHLGAKDAVVLGHSNGGRVAQSLALDPDLAASAVECVGAGVMIFGAGKIGQHGIPAPPGRAGRAQPSARGVD